MLRFVINLDRFPERWQAMQERLEKFGLTAERISAVDGRNLSEKKRKNWVPALDDISKINCPREILPGEIGCFISHRLCWQKLVDSNDDWALVLEDDIELSDRSINYIADTNWIPENIHLVQLHIWGRSWSSRVSRHKIQLATGDWLLKPIHPPALGTQAYLISKIAAKEALRLSNTLPCPVDNFLSGIYSSFAKKFATYRLNPAVVTTTDLPSSINAKNIIKALPYSPKIKNHPLRRWMKLKHQIYYSLYTKKETFIFK